jgi:SNF2 family DNA or RNA helicase
MELWSHQRRAVELARPWQGGKNDLALFFDVGTGKTGTMIYILREDYSVHGAIKPTLIFAPLSVCPQWKKEFARFSKIDQKHIHVLTGPGKKRTEALMEILRLKQPAIIVTNYEAVQIKPFYEALLKWSPEIVVADEAHKLKDSTGTRAKAIYPLAHAARRRFLLTGTPFPNGMLDIFGQYKFMNPSIFGGNFFKFKNRYFYDKNAAMPKHVHWPDWAPRPATAQELGAVIGSTSVQAKKSECLDLPPLLKIQVPVQLSPGQARTYETMKKQFVAELNGKVAVAEFAMTKTLRLQQIISGFIVPDEDDASPVWVPENPRLDALEELLETIGPEKTIIWTVFKPTYKMIGKICEKLGREVRFLTGEQSATKKQQAIEDFCRGPADTLIANAAAGGAGVNLTEAKYAIYYARGYSLTEYLQSEARNYRGGSDMHDKITHYHLTAEGTLDEVIAQALLNKQDVAETVLTWAKTSA